MNSDLIKDVNLEFPYRDQVCRFSLQLDLNEYSQKSMWVYFNRGELYEPETSQLFTQLLSPGDSVVDVGGHIGYFSLLAAAIVGTTGKVYTFEPETGNYQHLLANIERNGFHQINVFNLAVGDSEKDVEFYINADNDGGHALWDVGEHDFNEQSRLQKQIRTVHQTTLQQALSGQPLEHWRLLKMDTEGSEMNVLQGAKSLLQQHQPIIVSEINRFAMGQMGTGEPELRQFMSSLGYKSYFPQDNQLHEIADGNFVDCNYVFNMVFAMPGQLT